jgi:membrane dipeptidase
MRVIDLHCDTLSHLVDDRSIRLRSNQLSVDVQKLKKGNYLAQVFAMFVDQQKFPNCLQRALDMVDVFYGELEKETEGIALAKNYQELCRNQIEGKISAFLAIEEGGALMGKLENLRIFYRLGVRLLTLTWNYPNEIGYPNAQEQYRTCGLTDFGRQVVREMNRLGMLIDVSHLSDQGFYDVAEISNKPFVASHSNSRTICGHPRNLTDEMIRTLADKGGVMGLNFFSRFLGDSQISRIDDMVRHIRHIIHVGGEDVLAMGTDFDGIVCELEIEHSGRMELLMQRLQQSAFTTGQIEKFCFKNITRVLQECL